GSDDMENLALACGECNLHKGSDLTGIDPDTNQITPLYHPRHDQWNDHFAWKERYIIGLSSVGRTTARLLQFNAPARLRVRRPRKGKYMEKPRAAADIIVELLPLVPFEGWNQQALNQAAIAAGYKKTDAIRVFPGGAIDAAEYFIRSTDAAMLQAFSSY